MQAQKFKLQHKDLFWMFVRSNFFQASWNFERMQALGWCFSYVPVLKRLYPENSDARKKAIQSHLEFFNTTPFVAAPILGIAASMEEEMVNGAEIDESAINAIKVGMMGPLAGVGDPIFWGTFRPVFAALGASLAIQGSILGPILFFVLWNTVRLLTRYYGIIIGYNQGVSFVADSSAGVMQKLTEGASILGLFVIGVLINKWAHVKVIIPLPSTNGKKEILQNVFNELLPGMLPLLFTFLCMWLLRRGWSPITLIFALFAVGIIGYWIRLLGL